MKKYLVPALLLLLCSVLYGFNLGDLSLPKGDENYYFSSARRMIREGDFITPQYHNKLRFEKPILYYWLVALFFKLFGASWASARATSALMAFLTVLVTYLMSLRLLPKRAAPLAPVILATMFLFFRYARVAVIDMTFLFFTTASLYLLLKGDRENKGWCFILASIPLGLAIISKGPLALLLILFLAAFYMITTRRHAHVNTLDIVLGTCIVLLISLPWPAAMYMIHGQNYISHIWEVETVDKAVGIMAKIGSIANLPLFIVKYVGYYIPVVLFCFAPWSLFLPFALRRIGANTREDRIFIASWFWAVFLFFTLISFKHTHYMLLLAPPLAMIIAAYFADIKNSFLSKKAPAIIAVAAFAAYIFIAGYLMPALDDGAMREFSLKLASEIEENSEEIGIFSREFNLKKLGIHLNNLVSTADELGADDRAQYRSVDKDSVEQFLKSANRVYLLITRRDYEEHVPAPLQKQCYILENADIKKKIRPKEFIKKMSFKDWDSLKEEAYLVSNRR